MASHSNNKYLEWPCNIHGGKRLCLTLELVLLLILHLVSTFPPSFPLSVHCSMFRCCAAGWLMVNLGLGPGAERGEEVAAMKKRWHFTAIIHPCFVPAVLRSVCTRMERRVEGCRNGGMNGVGCGGWRGGGRIGVTGGLQGEEVMGLKCETPMRRG